MSEPGPWLGRAQWEREEDELLEVGCLLCGARAIGVCPDCSEVLDAVAG